MKRNGQLFDEILVWLLVSFSLLLSESSAIKELYESTAVNVLIGIIFILPMKLSLVSTIFGNTFSYRYYQIAVMWDIVWNKYYGEFPPNNGLPGFT